MKKTNETYYKPQIDIDYVKKCNEFYKKVIESEEFEKQFLKQQRELFMYGFSKGESIV